MHANTPTYTHAYDLRCGEFNDKTCKPLQGLQALKHRYFKKTIHLSLLETPPIFEACVDPGAAVGKRIVSARKGTFGAGC